MRTSKALLFSILVILFSLTHGYTIKVSGIYKGIDDIDRSFDSKYGRLLLIDATASWCPSCDQQLIYLKDVYDIASSQVSILTLSVDYENDNVEKVKEIQSRFNSPWEFGWDYQRDFQKVFTVNTLPSLFLFDEQGEYVQMWVGVTEPDIILKALNAEDSEIPVLAASSSTSEEIENQQSLIGSVFSNPIVLPVVSMVAIMVVYLKMTSKTSSE